jgi:hypothetical protein
LLFNFEWLLLSDPEVIAELVKMVDIFFLLFICNIVVLDGHLAQWFHCMRLVLSNLVLGSFIFLVLVAKREAKADRFWQFLLNNSSANNLLWHLVARGERFKQSSLKLIVRLVTSCRVYFPGST